MKRSRTLIGAVWPALILATLLIAVWEVAVQFSGVRPQILPAPSRVLEQGIAHRDDLVLHASATLGVTLVGFAVSLLVSWAIAIAVDFVPGLRRALTPFLVASQTLPIIAIAPLMIIWFGFGALPKILVILLVTFFPVALGLIEGFRSASPSATALLRSMGASRWQIFYRLRLPQALPRFFTALRIGITYAVVGAIFAEYVGAKSGLGIYMSVQKNSFRTDLVLAAVVVTALMSVTLFLLTYLVQRIVAPWTLSSPKESHS
ncbi:ABC transporter permease [Lysinibacter sp. HNR]|uniref:ABC transporter permease n=1 Tax=Lysinibacter sp. HNR TaxID=3031408 RepID=UPI002434AD70|nr:ABC transporter permease [Lysinibacter sp. HNR]WGD36455.1 ABC transporter permease [Lysinibacter sp. HNR]